MAMRIRKLGDPVLRERCRQVDDLDAEARKLIEEMCDALGEEPGRAGLAASQIGVLKRLFVYDIGYGPRCAVNPEILEGTGEETNEEGCLSLPGVTVEVPRFSNVKVSCRTATGMNVVIEAEDFPARLMQHECDHLDGVLIIDRCDSQERKRALDEYQEMELRKAMPESG